MLKKECPILNLVYFSVNFQATVSVQISLDFSFNYNSNDVNYFFLWFGSKVMKVNAGIAGNSACQDLLYWNWGRLDRYKAVMKPFFGGKRAQNNFKCSYNSYWQASFGILWLSSKEKILCHFFVRLGSFTKVDISLLFRNFCYNFYIGTASYISSFLNICLHNSGTNNCRKN